MLKWDDMYSVGVENIDAQHKHLFRISNDAYELLVNKHQASKHEKILQILEDLRRYAIFHFKTEEEYMLKIKSKQYSAHKIEHDFFVKKIKSIDFNKIDGNQEEHAKEVFDFIFNWILHHVLQTDKNSFEKNRLSDCSD